ncbi:MAG: hypothetical protein QXZ10_01000 [Sulfolobales archaeon]
MLLKLPPRVKLLEALGCVADGRVKILSDSEAEVVSSIGDRVYRVRVDLKTRKVSSNDNGTLYRNYVGYPIISFLMIKGLLPYDDEVANALKGINWRRINEEFKNYSLVEKYVKEVLKSKGIEEGYADKIIDEVLSKLKSLSLSKI